MIDVPELVALLVIGAAVWYATRWLNRTVPTKTVHGRADAAPRGQPKVEDLTACRVCGAYVAASARACSKPGCPLLR